MCQLSFTPIPLKAFLDAYNYLIFNQQCLCTFSRFCPVLMHTAYLIWFWKFNLFVTFSAFFYHRRVCPTFRWTTLRMLALICRRVRNLRKRDPAEGKKCDNFLLPPSLSKHFWTLTIIWFSTNNACALLLVFVQFWTILLTQFDFESVTFSAFLVGQMEHG